jgi:hypothetical protein
MPVLVDQNWVDIVPPEPPAQAVDSPLLWVLLAMVLAAGIVAIFWYQRRQYKKRVLRRMLYDLRVSDIDTKAGCSQVMSCLRESLGTRWLKSLSGDRDWQHYLRRLDKCCFSTKPVSSSELKALIKEGLQWLENKGRFD